MGWDSGPGQDRKTGTVSLAEHARRGPGGCWGAVSPRLGSRWVCLPHAQLSVCARNLVPSGRPLRSWPSSPMLPKVLLAGDVLGAYTWAGVQPAGLGGLLLAL